MQLRSYLGTVTLTPTVPDIGKPYYQAHSKIKTFALLENSDLGSNSLQWWTWWEPIRTISEVPFEVQIPLSKPFLFQTLSEAAITLKHQGLSYLAISKILKIDDKTVKKAIERGKKLLWLLMMPFGRSP